MNRPFDVGRDTGIFKPGEVEELLGDTLESLYNYALPLGHQAHALIAEDNVRGWVYFGPFDAEDATETAAGGTSTAERLESVWNLLWIGVDPKYHKQGYGKALLQFVEHKVKNDHGKRLIIETSSSPLLQATRDFYSRQGYELLHTERDGYGEGEDKLVFSKTLQ